MAIVADFQVLFFSTLFELDTVKFTGDQSIKDQMSDIVRASLVSFPTISSAARSVRHSLDPHVGSHNEE